ncbi:GntP family permease, partial [Aquabacterium sp. A08]|uniref:GntP family permease n=1 Tax=Aquabacterium sp. A08 TaxID=2718532 RepID=UPI00141E0129
MLGIAGILLSLGLLMALAYRGLSVLLLAPLAATVAVLFADAPLLASYTQVFMKALGGFVVLYFPLFLLGAVFGKLMEATGAAQALAAAIAARLGRSQAVLAVVAACALLTYGGVSLFVVAFAVYPIASELFRAAAVPQRLMPAAIALGAFTFTMTALPGTPAIQNAIPMPYFGTTPFAAPGLGVLGALVMLALGGWWLRWRVSRAQAAGEGYHSPASDAAAPAPARFKPAHREQAHGEGYDLAELSASPQATAHYGVALAPIVLVVALNYALSAWWLPRLDVAYLAEPLYGATRLEAVRGVWSIIVALLAANGLLLALGWRHLGAVSDTLNAGATAAVAPIFNTASQVGYGAVIASLAGFVLIRDAVLGLAPGNPLVSLSIAVNALAGITGSASGGMSIALQTLGSTYLGLAQAAGISPELLHRVTAIATGGLDALPHNGAVITLLTI